MKPKARKRIRKPPICPSFFMATRLQLNNSGVGNFSKLTNAYCLVATESSERLYRTLQAELADVIPVVKTSIGGASVVGCLIAGNKNGLLVPYSTTDQELLHLRINLPDSVVVQRLEEKLCVLGDCITCNDRVALIDPGVDPETEEMIADVLGVETFRETVGGNMNVGSCCALSNKGGLVHPDTSENALEELRMLFEIPFEAGTVNGGSKLITADLTVNDQIAFCGSRTTRRELSVIEDVFGFRGMQPTISVGHGRRSRQVDIKEDWAAFCEVDITATKISVLESTALEFPRLEPLLVVSRMVV